MSSTLIPRILVVDDEQDMRDLLCDLIESGGAMHGWDNGNAAQRDRYAETVEQIAALDGDMVAIGEEINRLNAIIDSKP